MSNYNADVYITNKTGARAFFEIAFQSGDETPTTTKRYLDPDQTMGPMVISFSAGKENYWSVTAKIPDGTTEGLYKNTPEKFAVELKKTDSNHKRIDVDVSTTSMTVTKSQDKNNPKATTVTRVGPYCEIRHIFVLMLENHSFDHIFGFSGLTGTDAADGSATSIRGLNGSETSAITLTEIYTVSHPAVDPMSTDPGHEFSDVMEQLCGAGVNTLAPKNKYPTINMTGFAANYAKTEYDDVILPEARRKDIVACCDEKQAPAIYELARNFAVCDNWYSSLPGPTWPNRFFAMAASSAGMFESPNVVQMGWWAGVDGYEFDNGSIFQRIKDNKLDFRIYQDEDGQFVDEELDEGWGGHYCIAAALKGITQTGVSDFADLENDLADDYKPVFTFIEPHYGNFEDEDYTHGSSQHPMDSLAAGDKMIAETYRIIRNSPLWRHSMLIVTYDEHGGYYDHVIPPAAVAPGDTKPVKTTDFDFKQYGVRVPGVVISPYIKKGTIDHTLYDHTSIIKTVTDVFKLKKLTKRDAAANSFINLPSGEYRTDCPTAVATPAAVPKARAVASAKTKKKRAMRGTLPLKGSIIGFLQIAAKAEAEMSNRSPASKAFIQAKVETIKTRAQARDYLRQVAAKIKAYRAIRRPYKQ